MGLNMMGKICFGLGVVATVVGMIQLIWFFSSVEDITSGAGDLTSGFKASKAVSGQFDITKVEVNVDGTNQPNAIQFKVDGVCDVSTACPVVTVMREGFCCGADHWNSIEVCSSMGCNGGYKEAVTCAHDADCTCVDLEGEAMITSTVCTLEEPETGTYFFQSTGGKVSASSPGRAQEALAAVGSNAGSAFKAFFLSWFFLACGCCTLCSTAVFYLAGPCQEDEDGYSSDAKE